MRAAQLSGDLRLEAAYLNSPHRLDSPLVPRTPHAAHSNASQGAIAAAGAAAAVSAAPEQAANQADSAAAAAQGDSTAELVFNLSLLGASGGSLVLSVMQACQLRAVKA